MSFVPKLAGKLPGALPLAISLFSKNKKKDDQPITPSLMTEGTSDPRQSLLSRRPHAY